MRACRTEDRTRPTFPTRSGPYLRPLPRPGSPRRAPAHPRPARGLRRLAVDREGRRLEWRMLPHDFPPWEAVYQQTQRWLAAGVFEAMAHDLRAGCCGWPPAASRSPRRRSSSIRTLRSTPEKSGARGGYYDGAKHKEGSKVHAAVDALGHLLALRVSPADEQDRAQVEELARSVQEATGESVELAYVDRGYAGEEAAQASGIRLEVVSHPRGQEGLRLAA